MPAWQYQRRGRGLSDAYPGVVTRYRSGEMLLTRFNRCLRRPRVKGKALGKDVEE